MKRTKGIITLLAVALVAWGCGDDATGPDEDDLIGTWDVVSVDGEELPITETDEGCTFTLSEADYAFRSNGTFSSRLEASFECDGSPAQDFDDTVEGRWEATDDEVTLTQPGFDEVTLEYRISSNRLTLTDPTDDTVVVLERR